MLASLEDLIHDDELWSRLRQGRLEVASREDFERLADFIDGGLPDLLAGLGYREPPPADALIDEMVSALALTAPDHVPFSQQSADGKAAAARTETARADLCLFAIRLRRVVGIPLSVPPSLARRVLRGATAEADEVLVAIAPLAIEAAATAAHTLVVPGAGWGVKLAGAVGTLVAARLAELRRRQVSERNDDTLERSVDRARRALVSLVSATDTFLPDVRRRDMREQAWIADEAVRRVLSLDREFPSGRDALAALRELRDRRDQDAAVIDMLAQHARDAFVAWRIHYGSSHPAADSSSTSIHDAETHIDPGEDEQTKYSAPD